MMNDLDIKNKRILLFDFDGTPVVCQGSSLIRIRYVLRMPELTIWTSFSLLVKILI